MDTQRGYIYNVEENESKKQYSIVLTLTNEVLGANHEIGDWISLDEVNEAVSKILKDPELYKKYIKEEL